MPTFVKSFFTIRFSRTWGRCFYRTVTGVKGWVCGWQSAFSLNSIEWSGWVWSWGCLCFALSLSIMEWESIIDSMIPRALSQAGKRVPLCLRRPQFITKICRLSRKWSLPSGIWYWGNFTCRTCRSEQEEFLVLRKKVTRVGSLKLAEEKKEPPWLYILKTSRPHNIDQNIPLCLSPPAAPGTYRVRRPESTCTMHP